jgi:serine protease AprX
VAVSREVDHPGKGMHIRLVTLAVVAALAAGCAAPSRASGPDVNAKIDPSIRRAAAVPGSIIPLIVRETTPQSSAAEQLVRGLGGSIGRELPIIGGFAAKVPGSAINDLIRAPEITRLWADGRVHMNADMGKFDTWAPNTIWRQTVRVPQAAQNGYTGLGVAVAIIDTGVSDVPDLKGRVIARVDFTPDRDGLDHYGHGTHLAGIIAGDGTASNGAYVGVAPKANIVSVKVAGWNGATDVSVVIAALQWVIAQRATYNIRVLNLSFGTDSRQSYKIDPLDYAVEQAWFSGIFVVVSAGNRGNGAGTINKPGDDPYVVTAGDANLVDSIKASDDYVQDFSSRGPTQDGYAKPDVVAPGITIVSALAPGSFAAALHPAAVINDYYIKGTGTSQAAAVTSGVAALIFQAVPKMSVNVAKATLMGTAGKNMASLAGAGAGLADAYGAVNNAISGTFAAYPANQGLTPSTGLGSLEASRGSLHVYADLNFDGIPEMVVGEVDVLGSPFSSSSWSSSSWSSSSWSSSSWSAYVWDSSSWSSSSWSSSSWSGMGWDSSSWSSSSWSSSSWSSSSWSSSSWSSSSWSANGWSSAFWNE